MLAFRRKLEYQQLILGSSVDDGGERNFTLERRKILLLVEGKVGLFWDFASVSDGSESLQNEKTFVREYELLIFLLEEGVSVLMTSYLLDVGFALDLLLQLLTDPSALLPSVVLFH